MTREVSPNPRMKASPLPPGVTVKFRLCQHSAPPTPVPAFVKNEVSRDNDGTDEEERTFESPARCFDCTIATAWAEDESIRAMPNDGFPDGTADERDRRIQQLWDKIKAEWEGSVRKAQDGDGHEMCSFVFYGATFVFGDDNKDRLEHVEIVWVPC